MNERTPPPPPRKEAFCSLPTGTIRTYFQQEALPRLLAGQVLGWGCFPITTPWQLPISLVPASGLLGVPSARDIGSFIC